MSGSLPTDGAVSPQVRSQLSVQTVTGDLPGSVGINRPFSPAGQRAGAGPGALGVVYRRSATVRWANGKGEWMSGNERDEAPDATRVTFAALWKGSAPYLHPHPRSRHIDPIRRTCSPTAMT